MNCSPALHPQRTAMQTAPNPPLQKRRELALARTAGLGSERNTVQDHQAHKNRRQRQTKHLCSPVLICPKHLRSCALICICHDVPCISVLFQQGKARARLGGRASIRRERSTIERDGKLYVSTIRRYENGRSDSRRIDSECKSASALEHTVPPN